MATKLDKFKAYDRIEWHYLKVVMQTMGFFDQWISLILNYVTLVYYFALVNEKLGEVFTPSRGLK